FIFSFSRCAWERRGTLRVATVGTRRINMRRLRYLFLLALIAYSLTGLTRVRPGERLVVRRFGRILDDKPGPGLYFALPWCIDRIDRVAVDAVRRVVVGYQPETEEDAVIPGQLLTGDHNLINLQLYIDYTVDPDHAEDYVVQAEQ